MVTLWFAALSSSLLGKSPTLVAHWNFANLDDQTVVTDVSGHHVDAQLLNGAKKVSLSDNTTKSFTAVLFLGNASNGAGFSAHHHSTIDKLYEFSIAFYINWWWAGADPVLAQKGGEDGFLLELYRQMPKVYIGDESGKIEYTWYPQQCAYLTPGQWKHVVLTYSDNGETNLYVDGVHCGDYRGSKGHLRSNDKDLTIGTFSGLVSDVRIYDKPIGQDLVDTICTPEILASYRAAPNFQTPSASAIAATNRGWRIDPVSANELSMYRAWLKHPNDTHTPFGHGFQALRLAALNLTRGTENFPLPLDTALEELELALGIKQGQDLEVEHAATVEAGTIIVGLCYSPALRALTTHSGVDPCAQITSEEGFALHTLSGIKPGQRRSLLIASGSASGALYGAFEVVRRLRRLGRLRLTSHMSGDPLHFVSNPSTAVRCINLWSQWRGFPFDAWMGWPAGREDSIFSWSDFLPGGNTTRARDFIRLLASVGINGLAPQDVNWDERNNWLLHQDALPVLGALARKYAVRLYFVPNFLIAPNRSTADKIYAAIPDFGGYLCKIGSEKQGGKPTPATVNAIAATLRNRSAGELEGRVILRGFIYGSEFHYKKKNRMAIPANFFGPYDGQYADNVYIAGKYTSLDFETAEPINALDCLLTKTKYGPEVVVGKSFTMSWVREWEKWLTFDTGRTDPSHPSSTHTDPSHHSSTLTYPSFAPTHPKHPSSIPTRTNRECTSALGGGVFLGVAMIRPLASWQENPLSMVNYYGFGRLAWDVTMTTDDIYEEWIDLTFPDNSDGVVSTGQQTIAATSIRSRSGDAHDGDDGAGDSDGDSYGGAAGDNGGDGYSGDGKNDPPRAQMHTILNSTESVANLLGIYHGYRGVWYEFEHDGSFRSPTSVNEQQIDKHGAGTPKSIADELMDEYSPSVRALYSQPTNPVTERVLLEFDVYELDYTLKSNGRTIKQDMVMRPQEGVNLTRQILQQWVSLQSWVVNTSGYGYYNTTLTQLQAFVDEGQEQASRVAAAVEKL